MAWQQLDKERMPWLPSHQVPTAVQACVQHSHPADLSQASLQQPHCLPTATSVSIAFLPRRTSTPRQGLSSGRCVLGHGCGQVAGKSPVCCLTPMPWFPSHFSPRVEGTDGGCAVLPHLPSAHGHGLTRPFPECGRKDIWGCKCHLATGLANALEVAQG